MIEPELGVLGPAVLAVLVRRGAEFTAAEDAVQEAMVEAVRRWPQRHPDDPQGWLVRVAWRKYLDEYRSAAARRHREERDARQPVPGPTEQADDTLLLLSHCCHPALTPASAIALTLRAVGGLTTAQIARAFLVPEATMAQRISRAKRTVAGAGDGPPSFDAPGAATAVHRVLYLMFNEGFTGEVDAAVEAIRLTRQLAAASDDPETAGLLALMLLHHARRPARFGPGGRLVPLGEQARPRWDTAMIAEGVAVLQSALARDQPGEYQAQAAIAALHDDAPTAAETDWPQIVEWYDELLRLSDSPVARLNRAVAVGEADGPLAGLAALDGVDPDLPRRTAAEAYLRERAGETTEAARLYRAAAELADNEPERAHLLRSAARLNAG